MTAPLDSAGTDPLHLRRERLSRALAAVEQVHRDPRAAREQAAALFAQDGRDEAACVALRARGLADKQLADVASARDRLTWAVALSEELGFPLRAIQARISLLVILADLGDTAGALAQAARAEEELGRFPAAAADRAHLAVNKGLVLQRTGRTNEALASYNDAEQTLRTPGEERWELLMLNMRGPLHAYRGDTAAARADLTRSVRVARANNFRGLLEQAVHNLGFAYLRSGDLPKALASFDEARDLAAQVGKRAEPILADRAEALLAAGLAQEARECAEEAAEGDERDGFAFNAAEARLMAARTAVALDPEAAALHAKSARTAFTRQGRPGWRHLARHVELAARYENGERSLGLLRSLERNTVELERAGWLITPQENRLLAAHTAAGINRPRTAERLYAQVASSRRSGPARARLLGWEAEAARLEASGDRIGAGRAVDHGLREVALYAGTLGSTDLRTGAAVLGTDLARTGLRLALAGGRPRQVLVRAEQWRATTLRRRPVRPPDDAAFAALLSQLRGVVAQITRDGSDRKDVSGLQTERLRLERRIREQARLAPGGAPAPDPKLDLDLLSARLGENALVEYARLDDALHAVTLVGGRARHYALGPYPEVLSELESLRFSLERIALRHGSAAVQQAAKAALEYARGRLDEMLIKPIAGQIGDRPLVLVPTGSLHALAWPLLPSLTERPLTVAPSARSWLTADGQGAGTGTEAGGAVGAAVGMKAGAGVGAAAGAGGGPGATRSAAGAGNGAGMGVVGAGVGGGGGGVLLAHGPGLNFAEAEIADLAKLYPTAKPLYGADATAQSVAEALDGASLAHIAAHGRFRADNPLFSALVLADGPLTVYDLEGIGRAPRTVVLSACETALSGIRPGDELMGVASAVFALGTRTLVASVAKVADEAAHSLMRVFHSRLIAGDAPTLALVAAQRAVPEALGFVCFGAG